MVATLKSQIPNPRLQGNPKSQIPNSRSESNFGAWVLELLWDLELGIWDFPLCVFQDFFDRRITGENAAQSILPQRHHPELDGFFLQRHRWRSFVDQLPQRVGDLHQFVNSFAAFVAGLVAGVAAFAVEKILRADIAAGKAELFQQRFSRLIRRAALWTN